MTDPSPEDKQQGPGSFEARLRAARARREEKAAPNSAGKSAGAGLGYAMRLGTELVAAVIVGGAIGLGLDYLLGTKPWLAVVFFVLGFVAGVINVIRVSQGYGSGVGWKKPDKPGDGAPGENEGE